MDVGDDYFDQQNLSDDNKSNDDESLEDDNITLNDEENDEDNDNIEEDVEEEEEEDDENEEDDDNILEDEDEEDDEDNNVDNIYDLNNINNMENTNFEDSDDDDDYDEKYLQKFNEEIKQNYILDAHPECESHNYDEVKALCNVVRDNNNNIIDDLHTTLPYLTKYEKTRILGQRAKQIDSGAQPLVKVPEHIIEGYLIAQLELQQKRIPFIIRRPLFGGKSEYWKIQDLEILV